MELVDGETLESRVLRAGPLLAGLALEIAAQTAEALIAAERLGLVHRDLKPANLMLAATGEDDGPRVKVIDFGLAKPAESTASAVLSVLTQGDFIGTPGFASPEQFDRHAPLDTRSDIFSLGVTLWYVLRGETPFAGHDLAEIHRQQTAAPLPVERLEAARVPPPIVRLLRELLSADLRQRPQSARVLAVRLLICRQECARRRPSFPGRSGWWTAGSLASATVVVGLIALSATKTSGPRPPTPGAATVTDGEKSIAVLPFENLSADPENAFFTEGVRSDIAASLGRLSGLKVITRTSVAAYRAADGRQTDPGPSRGPWALPT